MVRLWHEREVIITSEYKIHREKNKTKIQNGRRKQRGGQHTLACQKSIKQNKKSLYGYKLTINVQVRNQQQYERCVRYVSGT